MNSMNLKTRYNLFIARRHLGPSRGFKKDLWTKLSDRADALYPQPLSARRSLARLRYAAVMASVVLAAFGGTGVYAYTSPQVYEGTPLYPVKMAIERVAEKTVVTPAARLRFNLKQVERREAENKIMAVKKVNTVRLEKARARVEKLEDQVANQTEKTPVPLKIDAKSEQKLKAVLIRRANRLNASTTVPVVIPGKINKNVILPINKGRTNRTEDLPAGPPRPSVSEASRQ